MLKYIVNPCWSKYRSAWSYTNKSMCE